MTAESLIADLRADAASAHKLEPGSPHPTRPGWYACPNDCGIYRSGASIDREAC
jgi:hypothetical protein